MNVTTSLHRLKEAVKRYVWVPLLWFWGAALVLFLVGFFFMHLMLFLAPGQKLGYFWRYAVYDELFVKKPPAGLTPNWEDVRIESAPHDCEFLTAPLGQKNCHYEADISVIRPAPARWVGYLGHTSSDGGKTWEEVPPDQAIGKASVLVTWRRIEE